MKSYLSLIPISAKVRKRQSSPPTKSYDAALHCICCVYGNSSIQYGRNGFSDGTGSIGW